MRTYLHFQRASHKHHFICMKTAKGVEGEGFANFVHVVVYCKLFFSEIRSIMENPDYNKKTILYILREFTGNQKHRKQHRKVNTDVFLKQGGWGIRFSGRRKTQFKRECLLLLSYNAFSQPIRNW